MAAVDALAPVPPAAAEPLVRRSAAAAAVPDPSKAPPLSATMGTRGEDDAAAPVEGCASAEDAPELAAGPIESGLAALLLEASDVEEALGPPATLRLGAAPAVLLLTIGVLTLVLRSMMSLPWTMRLSLDRLSHGLIEFWCTYQTVTLWVPLSWQLNICVTQAAMDLELVCQNSTKIRSQIESILFNASWCAWLEVCSQPRLVV